MVGKTLGHYEILGPLGAGSMGEVYRARDTTLQRDVAIKVLSEDVADDPDRLARLEREAHLLASLNHPNIATIHSLERDGETRFLVLELVKGESLEQRLARGPLTVEKGLDFGKQIAEALEAAHGEGIIHRDLKPANVIITPDGRAKVLDFGVAKTVETGPLTTASQATNLTVAGTLIGTVPYMSPEQIRGEDIDKRADIWAFGCVLYEMLSGRHVFSRGTVADTLAAIIEQEPDWSVLPTSTPDAVRSLLHRCLQKDPKLRLRDIGDAWVEMNQFLTNPSGVVTGPVLRAGTVESAPPIPAWRTAAPWIAAAVVVGAALGVLGAWFSLGDRGAPGLSGMRHAEIGLPADQRLAGSIALSPDGLDLVYVAISEDEGRRLYHRPMGEPEATPLEGTEGAEAPFFSPDGEWAGFFAASDIKKVELSGGQALTVCGGCVAGTSSATWLPNQTIVFEGGGDLYQVQASGGDPTPFGQRDANVDWRYSRPSALPGSQGILIQLDRRDPGSANGIGVAILFPDSAAVQIDSGVGARPHYSPTGHVVFSRQAVLYKVPFDLQLLQATGQPDRVLDGVGPNFSLSSDGTLVYSTATPSSGDRVNEAVSVDLEGNVTPLIAIDESYGPKLYRDVRLSPDERRLALSVEEPAGGQQIWIYDIDGRTMDPITFEEPSREEPSRYPVWSHDSARVAFSTDMADQGIMWKAAGDLTGTPELLTTLRSRPGSFSPDGSVLAFRTWDERVTAGGSDIMLRPMEGDPTPRPFVSTPKEEGTPRFSPDGHWMTYTSDKTGGWEVYLVPYPGPGDSMRVSTTGDGGESAVWAPDGRSIYYRSGAKIMAVSFTAEPEPVLGAPELLFEGRYDLSSTLRARYDIAPRGEGFVMLTVPRPIDAPEGGQTSPDKINVVFNGLELLKPTQPSPGR